MMLTPFYWFSSSSALTLLRSGFMVKTELAACQRVPGVYSGSMKKMGLWSTFLLALPLPVLAQVTVEVTQQQQQFLPGEAMEVAVRITNRSGRPLHLGAGEDWLTFTIDSRE